MKKEEKKSTGFDDNWFGDFGATTTSKVESKPPQQQQPTKKQQQFDNLIDF